MSYEYMNVEIIKNLVKRVIVDYFKKNIRCHRRRRKKLHRLKLEYKMSKIVLFLRDILKVCIRKKKWKRNAVAINIHFKKVKIGTFTSMCFVILIHYVRASHFFDFLELRMILSFIPSNGLYTDVSIFKPIFFLKFIKIPIALL